MYRLTLLFVSLLIAVSFAMLLLSYYVDIDSQYDLLFETNTLLLVCYLSFVSREALKNNRTIRLGVTLLIINSAYEVITEITYFNLIANDYPMIDSIMEDGLLQLSFLLIAFGITNTVKRIQERANIDELTGLYNRKKLRSITLNEFDLIYIDLDGLKHINDTKGHLAGDLLIVRFAQVLANNINRREQAFRLGGDEFAITVQPGRSVEFICCIQEELFSEKIRFSYGIERTTRDNLNAALEKTDQAMYEMKHSQRQR